MHSETLRFCARNGRLAALKPKILSGLAGAEANTQCGEKLFSHYHMKVLHLLMNRLFLSRISKPRYYHILRPPIISFERARDALLFDITYHGNIRNRYGSDQRRSVPSAPRGLLTTRTLALAPPSARQNGGAHPHRGASPMGS